MYVTELLNANIPTVKQRDNVCHFVVYIVLLKNIILLKTLGFVASQSSIKVIMQYFLSKYGTYRNVFFSGHKLPICD